MRARTIIIGGGLIGLFAAREILTGGEPVTLLEVGHVGAGASWAGGGILSPLQPWRYASEVTRLSLLSQRLYPGLVKMLGADTGIDAEWRATGMLSLLETPPAEALAWARLWRQEMTLVADGSLRVLEPHVGELGSALWMPEVAQVRNPRLIKALHSDVVRRGGRIEEGVRVRGFQVHGARIQAVVTDDGDRPVDRCVIAAGAWSNALLASVGIDLSISPVKGQMLLIRAHPGDVRHIVQRGPYYLIPRADGRVLVGSTVEPEAGFDITTTDVARNDLHGAALALAPVLARYPVERQWAGLRPGVPGGVPFIGGHPEIAGLFICAGHFRNGIVLAPGSARVLADLMLGRRPSLDPVPYSPSRDLTLKPI